MAENLYIIVLKYLYIVKGFAALLLHSCKKKSYLLWNIWRNITLCYLHGHEHGHWGMERKGYKWDNNIAMPDIIIWSNTPSDKIRHVKTATSYVYMVILFCNVWQCIWLPSYFWFMVRHPQGCSNFFYAMNLTWSRSQRYRKNILGDQGQCSFYWSG